MWLWVVAIATFVLLLIEVSFRIWHRGRYGRPYHVSLKFKWDENHVVPHPFLSFAYRRFGGIKKNQTLPYPLHPNKYYSFKEPIKLNSLGHFGEEPAKVKKNEVLRIACVGSSPTANIIADSNRDYSYPAYLKEFLQNHIKDCSPWTEVEVLNCGIGGWTSVDIGVDYLLNVLPLKPDYVVFYHGLNDLPLYLTNDFASDYSHARYNFGEVIYKSRFAYFLPKIKLWHSYEYAKDSLFGTGNTRNDVLRFIIKEEADLDKPFPELSTERSIVRSSVAASKHQGVRWIFSSYAYYNFKPNQVRNKYESGVQLENKLWSELADEFNVPLIDIAGSIPKDPKYFLDTVHFTPEGMKFVAEEVGKGILSDLRNKK